jgi:sucrose-6-phosphate hydrolase SacC (GH32 family)
MSPFAIYGWFLFSLNPQTCLLRVLFISFLFWGTASFVMGQDAPSGQKPKVVKEAANGGREKYRPAYHFTPRKNWMNDPNGMVYFEGEWHLFFQYNPFGEKWGHMSWGHAVSRDFVHWEELPLALPEENGIMIFSGSAVVDWNNTTGFGKDGKPPLVAIYTGHREGRQDQRLAFSNDKGRTWNNFQGNPVLDVKMADFRDPKVFWNQKNQSWVMTVALAAEKKVHFYTSSDLKK